MEMGIYDYLFFLLLIVFAGFIFYRVFTRKKWCPDIFGGKGCSLDQSNKKSRNKQCRQMQKTKMR